MLSVLSQEKNKYRKFNLLGVELQEPYYSYKEAFKKREELKKK